MNMYFGGRSPLTYACDETPKHNASVWIDKMVSYNLAEQLSGPVAIHLHNIDSDLRVLHKKDWHNI